MGALAGAGACLGVLELLAGVSLPHGGRIARLRSRQGRRGARSVVEWAGRVLAAASPLRRFAPPASLRARIVGAGEPGSLGVREWLALKTACAGAAGIGGVLVGAGSPGRIPLLVAACAPAAGFLAPDLWLSRCSRRRAEAAVRELPDMLDLVRVTVEAGVSPVRALGMVAAEFSGPLATEWSRAATEVALGTSQDEALSRLVERLPAEEVRSFVDVLTRARRHGAPLGQLLAVQATRARHRRGRELRERAARAGPKIQLVVALLLVPSVLLMVAAALAAELLRTGLGLPGLGS